MFFFLLGTFLLLILSFLAHILYWCIWYKFSNFCKQLNKLPGPVPLPLIGNVHQLLGANICESIVSVCHEKWPETYGEIFRCYDLSMGGVCLSAPEYIEIILNNSDCMDKSREYEQLHPWLGSGLLTTPGCKWRERRRLLTPSFHYNILETFIDTFNEQSLIMCTKINELCHEKTTIEIDVTNLTNYCSLDIICESAMGFKIRSQIKDSAYVHALHRLLRLTVQKYKSFVYNKLNFVYYMIAEGRDYLKYLRIVRDFTDQVIRTRKYWFERSPSGRQRQLEDEYGIKKRRPFLDLLIEASGNGTILGDDDISDEVNTFMFEGHDTVASATDWFLYCMAANPQYQERVYEELNAVFGDSDRSCTRQDLCELKYLECCIKESMRLYPTIPVIMRTSSKPIRIANYQLPANCKFFISIYGVHHNPRIYPHPYTFDPDRFSPEQSKGRHPFAFIPFSAGPRNCIGLRFAMMEQKIVLSSMLRRFKFDLSPSAPKPKLAMEITLRSTTGIILLISPRLKKNVTRNN